MEIFFSPKSVALIGATEKTGSVGRSILSNLIASPFGGTIYPVNSRRSSVLGIKAYPSIGAVPDPIELAVIVTPASTVPEVIRECGGRGIKGAIVISAGFKEAGAHGAALESEVLIEARRCGMRLIGPNCLGVMSPITGFNATFAPRIARPGNVGFLSQSGAMCTAVLDWSLREQVGFSACVSTGSMADIGWGELIDHLGNDPKTRSIVIYMESVGDARSFLSAAREVALRKPIIVLKAGRTEQAAKAAASHTGTLAGSDEVLDAAFRRCGVLRVDHISEIFDMVKVLSLQPQPQGPRLLIVTNAGGPGVLATDALLSGGGELAPLSEHAIIGLNEFLPPHWSHANPVDLIGDAGPERYAGALAIAAKEPDTDGLLVIMTPQGMTDPARIAEGLQGYAKLPGKPVLASWMGGVDAAPGRRILNNAGIPSFAFPDTAVRSFLHMWKYSYNLRGLYETPAIVEEPGFESSRALAEAMIRNVRDSGRTLLTEAESKDLLHVYGIPVVETRVVADAADAVAAADSIGYPVVLKLNSTTVTHKTEVGGVHLNLIDAAAVRKAFSAMRESVSEKAGPQHFEGASVQPMVPSDGYELIIGSSTDSQFGPVLLFGAGGKLVEILQDRALGIPPLNTILARRMMEQTRIYRALGGVRGLKPVDIGELERILVRFSRLVIEQRWIREVDINPFLAGPEKLIALDARIVVWDKDTQETDLPRLAIRPYPTQYVKQWRLNDGSPVTIRPIRPEDEPLMVEFHRTLSERSVYMRYFGWMKLDQRTAHERLARMCFLDYDRQIALVAERIGEDGKREIVAVGRMAKLPHTSEAEVAFIVSDAFQGRGLGTEILHRFIDFAKDERLKTLRATLLRENRPMRKLLEKFGFQFSGDVREESLEARLEL